MSEKLNLYVRDLQTGLFVCFVMTINTLYFLQTMCSYVYSAMSDIRKTPKQLQHFNKMSCKQASYSLIVHTDVIGHVRPYMYTDTVLCMTWLCQQSIIRSMAKITLKFIWTLYMYSYAKSHYSMIINKKSWGDDFCW